MNLSLKIATGFGKALGAMLTEEGERMVGRLSDQVMKGPSQVDKYCVAASDGTR